MKIIHNLKDRVNRLVGIFIPKQDSDFIIDNNVAKSFNGIPAVDIHEIATVKVSSNRDYFITKTIALTTSSITVNIPNPINNDFLILEFFDKKGNKVIPYNIEYYSYSSVKTYPFVSIGNDGKVRILYNNTINTNGAFCWFTEDGGSSVQVAFRREGYS